MNQIFLSYSRRDTEIMQRVVNTLREEELIVWTDENLTPGTPSWKDSIQDAIENSQCIVALLSPDFKSSEWCERELDYARAMKPPRPIFPVLIRGDDSDAVPFELVNVQRANLQGDYLQGMAALLEALTKGLNLPATPLMLKMKSQAHETQKRIQEEQRKREEAAYEQRIQEEVERRLRDKEGSRLAELANLGYFFDFDQKTLEKNRRGKISFGQRLSITNREHRNNLLFQIAAFYYVPFLFMSIVFGSFISWFLAQSPLMSDTLNFLPFCFAPVLLPFIYMAWLMLRPYKYYYQKYEGYLQDTYYEDASKMVFLNQKGKAFLLSISPSTQKKRASFRQAGTILPYEPNSLYQVHVARRPDGKEYILSLER